MIKGYVFLNQLASNDVDSMIFRKMLGGHDGIINGMALTYSGSTITIGAGTMMIAGRPIGVVGSESVTATVSNTYNKLVAEIDLSKTATVSEFNQASFKILTGNMYSSITLTQEDMDNGGDVYQVELARFRTGSNATITDWQDISPQLDYNAIYEQVDTMVSALIDRLEQELQDVEGSSAWVLTTTYNDDKANYLQKKITSGSAAPSGGSNGDIYIQYFSE